MLDENTQEIVVETVVDEVPVEVVETEEVVETPAEEIATVEGDETADETADVAETTEEIAKEEAETSAEPVTFDAESPEFLAQANEVLEKYDLSELPQDLQALIPLLIAKANAVPVDTMAEYADYGKPEDVKVLLDRQALLTGVERVNDSEFRPTTNKFVETLDAQTGSWLYHDLAKQPSTEYQGITQFEEGIVNVFAQPGDTVGAVLARYEQFVSAMQSGAMSSDVPEFVPIELREAYFDLSKAERDEIALLDPQYEDDVTTIAQKLHTLERVQKGLDGDKAEKQREQQAKQERAQTFQTKVIDKQVTFYTGFREQFAKDLAKDVVFSTDPKMQTILANQHVSLLGDCFEDGPKGEFARKTLSDAGIAFDAVKAQQLLKDIEESAVALTIAEHTVDEKGKQLDEIALNKAASKFRQAGKAWQDTAKDVLGQLSRLTSTGKAEEIKTEVAKQKVALKARPATKGAPSTAKGGELGPPASVAYGSPEWDRWWAKQTQMELEAKKARQYA